MVSVMLLCMESVPSNLTLDKTDVGSKPFIENAFNDSLTMVASVSNLWLCVYT